jgi:2-polyprenyl-3-methyl-5-hydroxy-6-metoxy-1,4-benzoquinol methylase
MLRQRQPELMDDPALDSREHHLALCGLERINHWSKSVKNIWQPIAELAREIDPIRILDAATGGGDIPIGLWQMATQHNLSMRVDGCDVSPVAIAHAKAAAQRAGADVHFFQADVLRDQFPGRYDVVVASLFVHHLDPAQVVELFRRMAQPPCRLIVVNDLRRSTAALRFTQIGTRLLSRSPVVHVDGPRSVQGAYTIPEMGELARQGGLTDFTLRSLFPFRYLLKWRRI